MTTDITPLPIEAQPWKINDHRAGEVGNKQWLYRFANGYGASVVQGQYTYGGPEGLYELAVIKFDCPSGIWSGADQWELTYETPVTNDVLGWLSVEDVAAALVRIATLGTVALEHANA